MENLKKGAGKPLHESWVNRCEKLLEGFEPNFTFNPIDPLPREEFEERLRRIRREATVGNYDALVLHTDIVGWYAHLELIPSLRMRLDPGRSLNHPDGPG